MKKYFKSPDEAKKVDAKAVVKILAKVFSAGVEGSKFFYKAEFDYGTGEVAPFLYIGPPAGAWKQFIKDSKKDKDFVAGVCKLETQDGVQKLLMKAQMGKGSKAAFLKAVNKELLKKNSVKGEFVEELVLNVLADEEEEADDAPEATASEPKATTNVSPQEMTADLKGIVEVFKAIRVEHDAEQIDNLLDKLSDWEESYEGLSEQHKQALAASLVKANEVAAYLQKINQIDSKIDALMDKIYLLIDAYVEMEDYSSQEAIDAKIKVEKSIEKVEELAKKINDNDFLDACKEFRNALAV